MGKAQRTYTRHVSKLHTFYELASLGYIFVPHETLILTHEVDLASTDMVEYLSHDDIAVTVNYLTGYLKGQTGKIYDRSLLTKTVNYSIKFELSLPIIKSSLIG